MIKTFLKIFLILTLSLSTIGCKRNTSMIIFNKDPITKENLLSNATQFTAGKRIYYLFITEKKLNTDLIRVRVLKKGGTNVTYPVALVYSNDFKMKKDQIFYYDDYIVMNDAGEYCMVIYSRYALDYPLAIADFRVKK